MNINSELVSKQNNVTKDAQQPSSVNSAVEKTFKEELKGLAIEEVSEEVVEIQNTEGVQVGVSEKAQLELEMSNQVYKHQIQQQSPQVGVNQTEELSKVIEQFTQPVQAERGENIPQMNELSQSVPNKNAFLADNNTEEKDFVTQMLNNDMNINKPQDKMQELKADINFAQNGGEAFSSFLGQGAFRESSEELAEDNSILSDTAENIAMVNRAMALKNSQEAQPIDEVGVVIDRTISHNSLNLTENDINFFVSLAQNSVNFKDVGIEEQKSVQVSERLMNMLAESMRNNKAFRLNFDNDISIIIKVSREGRISAHFLPGSDIAENYLRNNLNSLVQKFEEENIPYDELTQQRQRRNNDEQQNKKDKK